MDGSFLTDLSDEMFSSICAFWGEYIFVCVSAFLFVIGLLFVSVFVFAFKFVFVLHLYLHPTSPPLIASPQPDAPSCSPALSLMVAIMMTTTTMMTMIVPYLTILPSERPIDRRKDQSFLETLSYHIIIYMTVFHHIYIISIIMIIITIMIIREAST